MFEQDLLDLLKPLVADQVFWDVTPDGYKITGPIIILQRVGGKDGWYIDQTQSDQKNARMQVGVWAKSRLVAAPLARLVEKTIADSSFVAEPLGAPMDQNQPDLKIFGSIQLFGIWYPDTV